MPRRWDGGEEAQVDWGGSADATRNTTGPRVARARSVWFWEECEVCRTRDGAGAPSSRPKRRRGISAVFSAQRSRTVGALERVRLARIQATAGLAAEGALLAE